jgi:hypothetical protein
MNLYENFINFKKKYNSTSSITPEEYKNLKRHNIVEEFFSSIPGDDVLALVEKDYDCFLHPLSVLSIAHRIPTIIKNEESLKEYTNSVEKKLKSLFKHDIISNIEHTHIIIQDSPLTIKLYPCMLYVVCIERFNNSLQVRYNIIDKESIKRLSTS